MKFSLAVATIFVTFLTNQIHGQNQCSNFVGKWQCRGETFTITDAGGVFKMAYKGPNYSSNEASPCNNGQLENEGMKLTYSSQEDAFYWDGRKFTRIGPKPVTTNQQPYSNQNNCSGFVGEWTSRSNGKFVITQSGSIFKMAYKGPNYSSNEASPCNNGQLENEGMKLTYSAQEDAFYWDGTKFSRVNSGNTQTNNNNNQQASNTTTPPQAPKEISYNSFRGFITGESENYTVRFKKVNFTGQFSAEAYIANKILEILPTIKRISQPETNVSDTLNLFATVDLSFSQEKSLNGSTAHFAYSNYTFSLTSSKTGKTLYQTSYSKSNQGLLAKGFSTQEQAALDVFEKSLNQFLNQFIIGNFPINATITEVTETSRKKDEAKFVKIDVGRNQGIYTGFEFLIPELNTDTKKGDLVVKEVYDTYSICKVAENEKKVLELFNAGQKIKVKTKYKP